MNSKLIGDHVIKTGEEKAKIQVVIGGSVSGQPEQYTIDMYFNEKNKKGRIKVYNSEGEEVKSGASFLKSLVGNVSFDVFEFIRKGKTPDGNVSTPGVREQVAIIKSLLPKDDQKKLFDLDAEYKSVYEERTFNNKTIDSLDALINNSTFSQEEIAKYSKPISIDELIRQQQAANKEVQMWEKITNGTAERKQKIASFKDASERNLKEIERLNAEIDRLKSVNAEIDSTVKSINDEVVKAGEWFKGKEKPSVEAINNSMLEANKHNANYERVREYSSAYEKKEAAKKKSDELSEKLDMIKAQKAEVFTNSKLPVQGLSFDDDRVYYNELPFDEQHQSKSVIIGAGMKIAMAMNPHLKVVTINDGSLLDSDTLSTVIKMADKYGYQLIIEIVGNPDEDVHVDFIETETLK
jgi:hypothetical protein